MHQKGLFNAIKYESEKKTFSEKIIKSNIMHADEKIKLRQEAQDKLNETNKSKKKKEQSPASVIGRERKDIINPISSQINQKSNIKHTSVISSTSKSKTTNNSSHIKKTKKI